MSEADAEVTKPSDPIVQYVILRRDLWTELGWPLGSIVAQVRKANVPPPLLSITYTPFISHPHIKCFSSELFDLILLTRVFGLVGMPCSNSRIVGE